jgi:hypothetical protein
VIDHFAELGLARAAWIEPEEIKSRHHALMSEAHPDKTCGDAERAGRLNTARRVLEQPASRIRHLLELEFPGFYPKEKTQPDWEFFSRIGEASRHSGEIASACLDAKSPLARAVASARIPEIRAEIAALQKELDHRASLLELKTKSLPIPLADPVVAFQIMEEWTFLKRWQSVVHKAAEIL